MGTPKVPHRLLFIMVVGMIIMISLKLMLKILNVHGHHYPIGLEELFEMIFPWIVTFLGAGIIVAIKLITVPSLKE